MRSLGTVDWDGRTPDRCFRSLAGPKHAEPNVFKAFEPAICFGGENPATSVTFRFPLRACSLQGENYDAYNALSQFRWAFCSRQHHSPRRRSLQKTNPEASAKSSPERFPPAAPSPQNELGGPVKLLVTVSPDGTVKSAEVLGGRPVLLNAAQNAAREWKWAPANAESKELVEIKFQRR